MVGERKYLETKHCKELEQNQALTLQVFLDTVQSHTHTNTRGLTMQLCKSQLWIDLYFFVWYILYKLYFFLSGCDVQKWQRDHVQTCKQAYRPKSWRFSCSWGEATWHSWPSEMSASLTSTPLERRSELSGLILQEKKIMSLEGLKLDVTSSSSEDDCHWFCAASKWECWLTAVL